MSSWKDKLAVLCCHHDLPSCVKRELQKLIADAIAEAETAAEVQAIEEDGGYDKGFSEGYDQGHADAGDSLCDDMSDGLRLIDTDRSTAKALIDRALRPYNRPLWQIAPRL